MKRLIALSAICLLAAGCTTINETPCYAEAGIGAWAYTTELAQNAGLIGETPTSLALYCQSGNLQAGWYHLSDVGRGWPFNDQAEWVSDALMIKYRVQVK